MALDRTQVRNPGGYSTWLFSSTLFLSAFLMFWLEPLIGKVVLPRLGGAPMVWNTCLVFFQATLLAGYAFAHGANRLAGPRGHLLVYCALVLVACFSLPFLIEGRAQPESSDNPLTWLLLVLGRSIGLPFLALAGGTSGLQMWFAAAHERTGKDPYWLYAASNVGSLSALILYPTLIEPRLTILTQNHLWGFGYMTFTALTVACAVVAWKHFSSVRNAPQAEVRGSGSRHAGWTPRLKWLLLSAVPSALLLAVTTYVSTDIAAVPLLWVAPLCLYLLTFIVAFASRSRSVGRTSAQRLPIFIASLALFMMPKIGASIVLMVPLHLAVFTLTAMMCHGELAAERPPASRLTEFYFWVACGGLVGGMFSTLVAPLLFNAVSEYPLMLVAACAMRALVQSCRWERRDRLADVMVSAGVGILTATAILGVQRWNISGPLAVLAFVLPNLICFGQSSRPVRFALAVGSMLAAGWLAGRPYGDVLYAQRTFFGVYRVSQDAHFHVLFHGTTLHGTQAIEKRRQSEPLSYYSKGGPIGQAFEELPTLQATGDVAIVGLGVGTLASYARPHQRWTFYEIDPAVERIARNTAHFTYLRRCGEQCRVVIGDARLAIGRAERGRYGLILVDAFSSDAIPVHLLTREALMLYLSRLAPRGILAFHISNNHLALGPVLARLAQSLSLTAIDQLHAGSRKTLADGATSSEWMLLAPDRRSLEPLMEDERWQTPAVIAPMALWTDDFSNVLSVLKF